MAKLDLNQKQIEQLYNIETKSLSQIAFIFNCSTQTILNRLKEFNIKRRSYSDSLKGRKILWKDKIGKKSLGRKLSKEARLKLSNSFLGRKAWNKGLRKYTNPDLIKYGKKGSDHPSWKGGISKENTKIRQSSEYKVWRDLVFKRDKYTCQKCKIIGGILNAHHIKSFATDIENRFNICNGITLCKKCHISITKELNNESKSKKNM